MRNLFAFHQPSLAGLSSDKGSLKAYNAKKGTLLKEVKNKNSSQFTQKSSFIWPGSEKNY